MGLRRNGSGEIVRTYPAGRCERLVLASSELHSLARRLDELAGSACSVLLQGDVGTGKSHLARQLVQRAPESQRLTLGCASVTDSEIASFVAHGLPAALAHGRVTLHLDEVAELSPWAQAVLLAALERAGSHDQGVRLVSTTHRALDALVHAGLFSARLAALLGEERLVLRPIRERRADIAPLALHFLRAALMRTEWDFVSLDPLVVVRLERHDWPGNAHELKSTMEHALALAVDGDISLRELPEALQRAEPAPKVG
jgi:DNA-binding NtrC family response regulator